MSAATAGTLSPKLERYRELFEKRFASDALIEHRRDAFNQFIQAGFPTPRDEAWKYTNLRRLESRDFAVAESAPVGIDPGQYPWISCTANRLVFINGHWSPALSSMMPQPPGATVLSLGEWLKHEPERAQAYLSNSPSAQTVFERLNAAFAEDGVVIDLAADAMFDEPVHVVHLWTAGLQSSMSHPRIIVRAGRNSRLTLIEQYLGLGDSALEYSEVFTNSVVGVELQNGAQMEHYRLQQEGPRTFHIGQISVRAREHARYAIHDLAFGGLLSRLNLTIQLQGSGSHTELKGLFTPDNSQHIDTQTRIEHIAPHTTSEEDYRGIAEGRGRGVFNGKVFVHQGAQKTDARQSSRNLLLSPTAEIDTKPELEIYANDVKCSHGATTGQLDTTALFYLRSRGISENDARTMLIQAFAQSIVSSIRSPEVRGYVETLLKGRFSLRQVNP